MRSLFSGRRGRSAAGARSPQCWIGSKKPKSRASTRVGIGDPCDWLRRQTTTLELRCYSQAWSPLSGCHFGDADSRSNVVELDAVSARTGGAPRVVRATQSLPGATAQPLTFQSSVLSPVTIKPSGVDRASALPFSERAEPRGVPGPSGAPACTCPASTTSSPAWLAAIGASGIGSAMRPPRRRPAAALLSMCRRQGASARAGEQELHLRAIARIDDARPGGPSRP